MARPSSMTYMMAETSFYRQETITARQWFGEGKFGEMLHVEGEYHHDHTGPNMQYWHAPRGPTWRYGFPPMHYPTHSAAFLTGVTGERIVEVSCMGWGDPAGRMPDTRGTSPPPRFLAVNRHIRAAASAV